MEKQHKIILVTGGAGFIGSHLIEKYLNEGHYIICVDNLQTTITPKNIERFFKNPNFRFIKHDIVFPLRLTEKIDWIFNCACPGSYTIYQYDPVQTVKTNTIGMINMLELAKKNNARILQTSTSEIYGDPLETPQKETYKGNVNSLGPRACYDEGKRVAETLCMDYHREYGVDVKIIRIFNTYGPNMDPNDGRAITNFIMKALTGKNLRVYGDGLYTRSFQYIDDLIIGIDAMIKKDNFTGPVNLGNPGEFTMKELAEKIISLTSSSSKITHEANATDDPKRRCPDISLAKKELGWEPKILLDEGLKKTIEYFKTVEIPESQILVFASSYFPEIGPAEQALLELSKNMPETKFHIITVRGRKALPVYEHTQNNYIYRIGMGHSFDKYLLPILGPQKAQSIIKTKHFHFIWAIMASYPGLAGMILKKKHKEMNFLVNFHESEKVEKWWQKYLYKKVFSSADSIFLSDISLKKNTDILKESASMTITSKNYTSFMNQVREEYARLINKKEQKLDRAK
jgi:UDP-glucuronate decarboxylase